MRKVCVLGDSRQQQTLFDLLAGIGLLAPPFSDVDPSEAARQFNQVGKFLNNLRTALPSEKLNDSVRAFDDARAHFDAGRYGKAAECYSESLLIIPPGMMSEVTCV